MKKYVKVVYICLVIGLIGSCLLYSYNSEKAFDERINTLSSTSVTLEIIDFNKRSTTGKEYTEEELKALGSAGYSYDITIKKYRDDGDSLYITNDEILFNLLESGKLKIGSTATCEDKYIVEDGVIVYSELDELKVQQAFVDSIK